MATLAVISNNAIPTNEVGFNGLNSIMTLTMTFYIILSLSMKGYCLYVQYRFIQEKYNILNYLYQIMRHTIVAFAQELTSMDSLY